MTTHEAMKFLGVSRQRFGRLCKYFGVHPVTVGHGRGQQSRWGRKDIEVIKDALKLAEKIQKLKVK